MATLRRILIDVAQSGVQMKTGFPACFLIVDHDDTYNDSGIPLLDKNTEYHIGDSIIKVRRCFGGKPLKELIQDLNIAVVSCQKGGQLM